MFATTDRLNRGDILKLKDGSIAFLMSSRTAIESQRPWLCMVLLQKGAKAADLMDVEVGPSHVAKTELQLAESGVFRVDELVRVERAKIDRRIGTATPRILIRIDELYKANLVGDHRRGG
jgi:hypothetical protein